MVEMAELLVAIYIHGLGTALRWTPMHAAAADRPTTRLVQSTTFRVSVVGELDTIATSLGRSLVDCSGAQLVRGVASEGI